MADCTSPCMHAALHVASGHSLAFQWQSDRTNTHEHVGLHGDVMRCSMLHTHRHTHSRFCAQTLNSHRLALQWPCTRQSVLLSNYVVHVPLAGIVPHGDAVQHRGPPRDLLEHNLVDKWLRGVGPLALSSCSEHRNVRMSTLIAPDVFMH